VWIDQRGSEVLTRNECLRLLALHAGGVGRLGFVSASNVVVLPVNYRMLDGDLVIQVGAGSMLDAAVQKEVVTFEVDAVSVDDSSAWSVLVHGLARVVDEDRQAAAAQPRGDLPFVPEPGSSFVRIRTGVMSGRRFPIRPGPSAPGATGPPAKSPAAVAQLADLALRPPVRLGRDVTMREVAGAMADGHVSCVLVGEHPAWLVTEHDLAGAVASSLDGTAPAAAVATKTPIWATTSSSVAEAVQMMLGHGVRHLVVITPQGEPMGTLSLIDAVMLLQG
jgi:uncharacterized protein